MTDYFCHQSSVKGEKCLVVLHNGGAQRGHCQTGDTMIMTKYGIKYLEDIVGEKISKEKTYCVLNMNGEPEDTSLLYRQNDVIVNKIVLQNGVEMKCTDEHRYYVWNSQKCTTEWVKSINLDKNIHQFIFPKSFDNYSGTDNFKINREFISTSHNKRKLDIENLDIDYNLIAEVMGMCNSDGYYKKKGISYIYNLKQPELKTKMQNFCNMFGIKYSVRKKENTDQCEVINIFSTDLVECLKSIGCHWEVKTNKSTPKFVLEGTKEIMASYIRGLIDTDGSVVSFDLKSKRGKSGKIKFTNTSFKIIKELQQMLFLLGINSSIKLAAGRVIGSPKLELQIASFNDLVLYKEKIGFISEYNRDKLFHLIEEKKKTLNKNGNGSKILMNKKLIDYIYTLNHKRNYKDNQKCICTGMILNNNSVKDKLPDIYQLASNYNFISINEINYKISKETVFDITMPKTHSYLANGTISHNTVIFPSGPRHVFHHFGSGTFTGADTYLSEDFILNPMVFRQEWEELENLGVSPKVYINPYCKVTTPFDMLLNQMKEELRFKRSNSRHGSCGMGIYETQKRDYCSFSAKGWSKNTRKQNMTYLRRIRDNYFLKFVDNMPQYIIEEWENIINSEILVENFVSDMEFVFSHSIFSNDKETVRKYDCLVFEGGQGLLLDQNNTEYYPHLTPSNTGITNPLKIIDRLSSVSEIEVCYVTRTYLTRHGAGRLDGECDKAEINPDMKDLTNVPNPHQGTLRYAKLDEKSLEERILSDFAPAREYGAKLSLAVTHVNEYDYGFSRRFKENFDSIYFSDGEMRELVRKSIRTPENDKNTQND